MLLEVLRLRSVIDYEDLDTEDAAEHIKSILDFLQIKKTVCIKVDLLFKPWAFSFKYFTLSM